MGSGQELHVQVICNEDSAEVSQQLELRRKTLGSAAGWTKDTLRVSHALLGDGARHNFNIWNSEKEKKNTNNIAKRDYTSEPVWFIGIYLYFYILL